MLDGNSIFSYARSITPVLKRFQLVRIPINGTGYFSPPLKRIAVQTPICVYIEGRVFR